MLETIGSRVKKARKYAGLTRYPAGFLSPKFYHLQCVYKKYRENDNKISFLRLPIYRFYDIMNPSKQTTP